MSSQNHWNTVYEGREDRDLTWYEARPDQSLEMIAAYSTFDQPVIDVGAGASRLVDFLLAEGYRDVTVMDLAQSALDMARRRLGPDAAKVRWITADATQWRAKRPYGLWHDRAVFHFMTEAGDRASYVAAMAQALAEGGHAIIASFAEDGQQKCSGLPVIRYSPDSLAAELAKNAAGVFERVNARSFNHTTPSGGQQKFQVSVFRKCG